MTHEEAVIRAFVERETLREECDRLREELRDLRTKNSGLAAEIKELTAQVGALQDPFSN